MAPKPFGKTGRKRWSIPRSGRIALWTLAAGPVAWLVFLLPSRRYPVLDDTPVLLATIGFFAVLFTHAAVKTFRSRPVPRPPGEGGFSRWAGPFFLGLAVGLPVALAAALFFEPALLVVNGALGRSSGRKAWVMVELRDRKAALVSPYWRDDMAVNPRSLAGSPPQPGDTAELDLGEGFLGLTWIRDMKLEELR